MMSDSEKTENQSAANWRELEQEPMPKPSGVPFFTALGLTLLFWGLISSNVILAFGFVLFGLGLAFWIREINPSEKRHE